MLEDINTAISWVLRKVQDYDGDPGNVYLCGQSAGGHLAAVAMLTQVISEFCWDEQTGISQ